MYESLFRRFSNSSIVFDCANAAPTAWRSRKREISSLAATTRVVVVVVRVLGTLTVV